MWPYIVTLFYLIFKRKRCVELPFPVSLLEYRDIITIGQQKILCLKWNWYLILK